MSRTPTTTDTTVEWEEKVTDPDSDQLTITLVLDAVDDGSGFTNDGTDSSNLSWLSFSKDKSTLADGTTEVLVNIVADKSGLDQGYSYRFKITADDGTTAVDRTFTLSIENPPIYNGSRVYVSSSGDNYTQEYSLPGEYDFSSSTVEESDGVAPGTSISTIRFSEDGTIMHICNGNDALYQYSLSTAWSLSSASQQATFTTSGIGQGYGIDWAKNGEKMYYHTLYDLYEYDVSIPYDITSTLTQVNSITFDYNFAGSPYVKNDGTLYYQTDRNNNSLHEYEMTTPYDTSTINNTFSVNLENDLGLVDSSEALWVKPDGTSIYVIAKSNSDDLVEIPLGTAWDLSTYQSHNNYTLFNADNNKTGLIIAGP